MSDGFLITGLEKKSQLFLNSTRARLIVEQATAGSKHEFDGCKIVIKDSGVSSACRDTEIA